MNQVFALEIHKICPNLTLRPPRLGCDLVLGPTALRRHGGGVAGTSRFESSLSSDEPRQDLDRRKRYHFRNTVPAGARQLQLADAPRQAVGVTGAPGGGGSDMGATCSSKSVAQRRKPGAASAPEVTGNGPHASTPSTNNATTSAASQWEPSDPRTGSRAVAEAPTRVFHALQRLF